MKKSFSKKTLKCLIIIVGVVVIPLLYSYFYLGAFWDPYSSLNTLPVAVVNSDKGAYINGSFRNLGREMCDKLNDDASLKFIFTDQSNAQSGTEGTKYYAYISIPQDFSSNIASADSQDKKTATIVFSPNEKRNFLASQILSRAVLEFEESARADVNKDLVTSLADKLKAVPDQLKDLQDGFVKLSDGSTDLYNGAVSLNDGTQAFYDNFVQYQDGVRNLNDASKKINAGAVSLDNGISQLLKAVSSFNFSSEDIAKLTQGASTLAQGTKTFNDNLGVYSSGVDSLIIQAQTTSDFLTRYVTKNPSVLNDPDFAAFIQKMSDPQTASNLQKLQAANSQIKTASSQILTGAEQISQNAGALTQLKPGLDQLKQGLNQVKVGSSSLADGTKEFSQNMDSLNSATGELVTAADAINSGSASLKDGSSDLNDGINTAKSSVDSAAYEASDKVKTLDGLSEFAKTPVKIEQQNINPVPNYGTAFAPYFLSLSLWVGALIIFFGIFLDPDGRFNILSRNTEKKVARSFSYILIGLIQAVVLALVVKYSLGLDVKNMPLYFVSCCIVSVTFIAIVQFLLVHLKDLGKFLAIAFLILQLTSCGGTFPMETVPKIFNMLYPFMPMTYSVALLKESISGINITNVIQNSMILGIIFAAFLTLTIVLSLVKKTANKDLNEKAAVPAIQKEIPNAH